MAFIDGVYSHYQYVKSRVIATNPNRVVAGHMLAQDWPPKNIKSEAFYLLVLGEQPIGKQGFSPYIPIVGHEFQWQWVIQGADISAGQVGPNRGSRFNTHYQMQDELHTAMSPYFCEKQSWGYDTSTPPVWTGTSLTPQEYIFWAPPQYHVRVDKNSGLVYGTAAVRVWDMLDPITT